MITPSEMSVFLVHSLEDQTLNFFCLYAVVSCYSVLTGFGSYLEGDEANAVNRAELSCLELVSYIKPRA